MAGASFGVMPGQTSALTAALRGLPQTGVAKKPVAAPGGNTAAAYRAPELSNERTRAEIDALKKDLEFKNRSLTLDEEMRRKSAADSDVIRDMLMKQFGGGGVSFPTGGNTVGNMRPDAAPAVPSVPGVPSVGDQAFARAKDRSGLSLQSGLRTLKGVMQRGGQSGSSIERDAIGGLIGGETQRMADVDLATASAAARRGEQLEDRAHDDQWREREFQDKTKQSGLEMLLRLMTASRVY